MNTLDRSSQIDAIISCQEQIMENESYRLCQELRSLKSFSAGLQKVYDTQKKINVFICNALLSRPVKTRNEWQLMNDFFDKLPKKLLSIQNYNIFLKQAGQARNFDKVAEIFFKVKQKADIVTYNSFIDAAGKNGKFEEAKAAFEEAKKAGKANIVTYSSFIDAAGKNGKFEEAEIAFKEAKKAGNANIVTYGSFIDAAGKNGKFEEAKAAFEEAKKAGKANIVTYSSFIDAAGKNGKFEEAKAAFEEAKKTGKANIVTSNSFIDAAGKNGKFEEAKAAFETACHLKINDFITTHVYVDILVQMGSLEEARTICNRTRLPHPPIVQNNKLDLHHYSHGTGFLAVSRFLTKNPHLNSLGIICGKGCQENENHLAFRQDLVKLVQTHLKEWQVKFIEHNEGEIQLIRPLNSLQNKT
jgi:pentatricopeptide repeat protein